MYATCEKKTKVQDGAQILNEECTSNVESLGNIIASGTIETSTNETKEILVKDEFLTATSDGDTKYYYVVLEYPNLSISQNNDIGGTYSGEVTVEESDNKPDVNTLAAYIESDDGYKETKDISTSGYALNNEKSTCTNGAVPTWDIRNSSLKINNLTKSGTSCYLYFRAFRASDIIFLNAKTISERTNFSTTLTTDTTGTIFKAEDDDGISYYFAGNPSDNWVKFAGFYWRIIRINGDGTIRLIYNGTSAAATGTGTLAKTGVAYNTSYNNNIYVGYMYTSGNVHGYDTASNIKTQLDSWYDSNLTSYDSYLNANAGFCNDRVPYTNNLGTTSGGGTGTTETYYAARIRLYKNGNVDNAAPSFKCIENEDLFTLNSSTKGNKKLSRPIGLITVDEVAYAGGVNEINNTSYYLYNGQRYWTISPSCYYQGYAFAYIINTDGNIVSSMVNYTSFNARLVINLMHPLNYQVPELLQIRML